MALRIGSLLHASLERIGIRQNVTAARVVDAGNQALTEIFGKNIGTMLRATSFERGELHIKFSDTVAASEARNRTEDILRSIQEALPSCGVARIVLRPATE